MTKHNKTSKGKRKKNSNYVDVSNVATQNVSLLSVELQRSLDDSLLGFSRERPTTKQKIEAHSRAVSFWVW